MPHLHRVVTQIEEYSRPPASPLKTLRALSNLSVTEGSRLADIDRATWRRIESGVCRPQPRTARKIAAVLGCPVELLFPVNDEEVAGQRPLATASTDAAGPRGGGGP